MERYRDRLVYGVEELDRGLDGLAERLRPKIAEGGWTVVTILGGAMIFAADLVRRLPAGLVMDFIRIQTYGDSTSPQNTPQLDWTPNPQNIAGRRVLLLDDILDTGRTMTEARRFLMEEMGAAEVMTVVLIDKPARRAVAIEPDEHVIRMAEDLFLVGYGLDYAGLFRNLPDLRALELGADGRPIPLEKEQA